MRGLGFWLALKMARGVGGGSESGRRKGWRIFCALEATACTRAISGGRRSPPQAGVASPRASVASLRLTEPALRPEAPWGSALPAAGPGSHSSSERRAHPQ